MKKQIINLTLSFIAIYLAVKGFFEPAGAAFAALGLGGIDATSSEGCEDCDSGLARLLVLECDAIDLDATVFDPETGCITSLAITGTGLGGLYIPDKDDTSFLNFIGERPNDGAVHNVNVDGFTKFKCLNKNKVSEANKLKKGCCFILIAEYNDCNVMVAGLDIISNCSVDGEVRFSKREIKGTVSLYGGTGADESRMEVIWSGQQRCFTALDQDLQTFDDILTAAGVAA